MSIYLRFIAVIFSLFTGLFTGLVQAQVIVPNNAISITFPKTQAQFALKNSGKLPIVVQLDLANRSDVYMTNSDGLAVIYPRISRIEPGATQKISAIWRGNQDSSHYYYIRVNTVLEAELNRDRANDSSDNGLTAQVGQAFPLNIISPSARPALSIAIRGEQLWLHNRGAGGDFLDAIKLQDGRIAQVGKFMIPGQKMLMEGLDSSQTVSAAKLRKFGWITLGDK
jgi:P pilus assembly chaperone PapD